MTRPLADELHAKLLRADGQEDLCLAVYRPSTGAARTTALLVQPVMPEPGETEVHGNVSFSGAYVLRAIALATNAGGGVAILHSHPGGRGWQLMSSWDADAESSYAFLAQEITGLPLVGLTLAGTDKAWSARVWRCSAQTTTPAHCESVRVIGDTFNVSWNDALVRPSPSTATQIRTVSCWGQRTQENITRLRILVVGAGTLGLDVAVRLAASGFFRLGLMDFDTLKAVNRDRMPSATELDVLVHRSKVDVVARAVRASATAAKLELETYDTSICEPDALSTALDYDIVICCVDEHPWPRSILNTIAYSDLVPVVDGGIGIDAFEDGDGIRNATWRSHVLRPGRPCMSCNGQIDLGQVWADHDGLLHDNTYIRGLPAVAQPRGENVALLSGSASASLLAQLASFLVAPAGIGEPGPLRYSLSTHTLDRVQATTRKACAVENNPSAGDARQLLVDAHTHARQVMAERARVQHRPVIRLALLAESLVRAASDALTRVLRAATSADRSK